MAGFPVQGFLRLRSTSQLYCILLWTSGSSSKLLWMWWDLVPCQCKTEFPRPCWLCIRGHSQHLESTCVPCHVALLSLKAAMENLSWILETLRISLRNPISGRSPIPPKGSPDWFYLNITRWSYLKINWLRTLIISSKSFWSSTLIISVWVSGTVYKIQQRWESWGYLRILPSRADELVECSVSITTTTTSSKPLRSTPCWATSFSRIKAGGALLYLDLFI